MDWEGPELPEKEGAVKEEAEVWERMDTEEGVEMPECMEIMSDTSTANMFSRDSGTIGVYE